MFESSSQYCKIIFGHLQVNSTFLIGPKILRICKRSVGQGRGDKKKYICWSQWFICQMLRLLHRAQKWIVGPGRIDKTRSLCCGHEEFSLCSIFLRWTLNLKVGLGRRGMMNLMFKAVNTFDVPRLWPRISKLLADIPIWCFFFFVWNSTIWVCSDVCPLTPNFNVDSDTRGNHWARLLSINIEIWGLGNQLKQEQWLCMCVSKGEGGEHFFLPRYFGGGRLSCCKLGPHAPWRAITRSHVSLEVFSAHGQKTIMIWQSLFLFSFSLISFAVLPLRQRENAAVVAWPRHSRKPMSSIYVSNR